MGSRLQEIKSNLDKTLHDKSKPWTSCLAYAENKIGCDRLYIFVGGVAFIALYMVFGYGAQLLCSIIGFLYPAYASMKALETPHKDDDTKWLTYWVSFAMFSIVEYFADIIVYWFPFYWLLKCIFHIWCFIPLEINGSLIIYRRIIRPYFLKYHQGIDRTVGQLADEAKVLVGDTLKKGL